MFTPADMERMPKNLEQLYADLELRIMQDIIRRIKINGEITRAADWQIYRLHELGESKRVIRKMIRDSLKLSNLEVKKLYKDAIRSGYAREESLYKAAGTPLISFEKNAILQQTIKAVRKQTQEQFKNITQSLGFTENINGKIQFTELSDFYQKTLDAAMLDITSGAFDYNTVLRRTVATMTNSGLRTVDYASGWSNRIEVAVRRAVMTGVTQVTGKINEQNAEELHTDYFEISWHADARPTHQIWQGKVYSKKELETVCGLGTVDGLGGANCRHTYYPFIPGISERAYTDEQLEEMNAKENTPKEFRGKQYTSYEASQKQRHMETVMRAQRQKIKLLQDGGASEDDIIAARCRYRKTMSDYVEFSKAMGIPQQRARIYGDGLGNVGVGKIKKNVANQTDSGILKLTSDEQYALNQYLGFDSYVINEKLRNGISLSDSENKTVEFLDSALKKMPYFKGNLSRSLYFGNSDDVKECLEHFVVGEDIIFDEYISTTCGPELYNPKGEIQIYIDGATRGRDISAINTKEQEVLYERGSKFTVLNVTEANSKYWVLLEEM